MVLPRSMRLKGHKCFDYLHRSGVRYQSSYMVLKVVNAKKKLLKSSNCNDIDLTCRCAVAISNKVSKRAVTRNRLRRLIHSHLRARLEKNNLNINKWALLSLKPNSLQIELFPLLAECDKLLNKAGLLA